MLVLRRKENQFVEVTHKSGDVIRIGVNHLRHRRGEGLGQVDMVFDDQARNFSIQRPERSLVEAAEPVAV